MPPEGLVSRYQNIAVETSHRLTADSADCQRPDYRRGRTRSKMIFAKLLFLQKALMLPRKSDRVACLQGSDAYPACG